MNVLEITLTHAERTPSGLALHFTRTEGHTVTGHDSVQHSVTGCDAVQVPSGAGYTLTGRFSAPSLTLLVCADPEQPSRPTFAALVTPATWPALAALLLKED